eukprot:TRINITY_DN13507_c0_g1_i1.p1 TRINITY_DN13507_c0_g1~~TRINITY_DN13507_c0_g1_i1.p1  ORF type:complete len:192 (-),score=30.48 TRINITY_DN13507_c0_g1_i1:35-610(-)
MNLMLRPYSLPSSMACGCGMSAVRALAREAAVSGPKGWSCSASAMATEKSGSSSAPRAVKQSAASASEAMTLTTFASIDDLYLDNAFLSDDEDDDSSDEGDSCTEFQLSRALTTSDIPDPSQFLKPEEYAAYMQLHSSHDSLSTASDESDVDEMYVSHFQPERTSVRRDLPAPTEYLTKAELSDYLSGFEG